MTPNIQLFEDERLDAVNDNITLIQKKNGLTFGTDALLLAAFLRGGAKQTALDLGAGTGILSLLCAARGRFAEIYAVEAQAEFCDLIVRNAALNHLDDRIVCVHRDVRKLVPTDIGGECDVVFTNPPYMRAGSGKSNLHDVKTMARHEMLGGIDDFCAAAARNLKYGGLFYAVYRPERTAELFYAMHGVGIEPKRLCAVCPDSDSAPSLILVEGKKGAAAGLIFESPLILYADAAHTAYTRETQFIYDNGRFSKWK
mgnify:CR=1 FL=1